MTDQRCRVCGARTENGEGCPECSVTTAETSGLPAYANAVAPAPSAHPSLQPHPDNAWRLQISGNEFNQILRCTQSDLQYREALPPDGELVFWCPQDQNQLWVRIIDETKSASIRIANRAVTSGCLRPGDLLTIGSYGWIFHAYPKGHGFGLEPVNPIPGASLAMENVTVSNGPGSDPRLDIKHLHIDAGEFVGIVGQSGAGKSTLVTEIVDTRQGTGTVMIDGLDRSGQDDPAPKQISYLPQADIVHHDLTIGQQALDYVQMVDGNCTRSDVEEAFHSVGLRDEYDKFPRELSGGQLRRARLAGGLARNPRVLLLDEPDSGLDPETAIDVRRLLKTISLLGATVVTVTHHQHGGDLFDRTLTIEQGRIIDDFQSPHHNKEIDTEPSVTTTHEPESVGRLKQTFVFLRRNLNQFRQQVFAHCRLPGWAERLQEKLAKRVILRNFTIPHWAFTLILMPVFFAVAISLSAPRFERYPYLVSFLGVLSVIWMAASQSHLALTTTWDRIDFERVQGLKPYPYLFAKSVFLTLIMLAQVLVFVATLNFTSHKALDRPVFAGDVPYSEGAKEPETADTSENTSSVVGGIFSEPAMPQFLGILCLVGFAASQMGLLISVIAQNRTTVAAALLPLLMITQLLFSVFVVKARDSKTTVETAYAGFWLTDACNGPNCPSSHTLYRTWIASPTKEPTEEPSRPNNPGFFVCVDCDYDLTFVDAQEEGEDPNPLKRLENLNASDLKQRTENNSKLPGAWATAISYATLTRYADLAMRPILKPQRESHEKKYCYHEIQKESMWQLLGIGLICHFTVAAMMGCGMFSIALSLGKQFKGRFSKGSVACLATICLLSVSDHSQAQAPTPKPTITHLKLKDGHYDASPLSGLLRKESSDENLLFPFTNRTRLALGLLKVQGVIEDFEVLDDSIRIQYSAESREDVVHSFFPPKLLGTDEIGDSLRVAILVHGLEGGELTYIDWAPALKEHGWHCLRMLYPNDGGIKKPADFLRSELKSLQADHPKTRFVILAHSLGGLVTWSALTSSHPDELSNVTDFFSLGTPYLGSKLAVLQAELELADVAVRLWKKDWTGLNTMSDGDGQAIEVLRPESLERKLLIKHKLPAAVNFHVAVGNAGPIHQSDRESLGKLFKSLADRMNFRDKLRAKLETVVAANEIYEGLGDGAVTLESAMWPQKKYTGDVKSFRVFSRSHTGLLRIGKPQDELLDWVLERIQ